MSEKNKQGNKRLQLAFALAVLIGAIILLIATEWGSKAPEVPPTPPDAPRTGSITTPPNISAASPFQGGATTPSASPVVFESGPTPVRAFHATPSAPPPPEERSSLADALNTPASDGHRDLTIVADLLSHYRDHFRELPVGNNPEITAALAGDNTRGLALIPADHPAINAQGELIDRWGTPFFFHQLGRGVMQIRSSGPDRRRFTEDDLLLPPAPPAGASGEDGQSGS